MDSRAANKLKELSDKINKLGNLGKQPREV